MGVKARKISLKGDRISVKNIQEKPADCKKKSVGQWTGQPFFMRRSGQKQPGNGCRFAAAGIGEIVEKRKKPCLGVERTANYDIIAGDIKEFLDVCRIREANMNRNRKPIGRKKCLKMMGVLLASAMVTAGTGGQVVYASGQDSRIETSDKENKEELVIYLNGEKGSDSNSGTSRKKAVKTFRQAVRLVGEEGKILICGTVTVEDEEIWELPDDVSLQAAEDFSDPWVCVNGSLTLENVGISESRITGDGEVEGAVRESLVKVPEVITVEQPVALAEISLEDCEGQGTFAWENAEEIPSAWETEYSVIFRPEDPDAEDYSLEEGWEEEIGVVIRQVTVRVLSLEENQDDQELPEEPENGDGTDNSQTPETDTDTPVSGEDSDEAQTGTETGEASDAGEEGNGSGQTPEEGTETPDGGEDGSQQESPEAGTETPEVGTESPEAGAESPEAGTETPDNETPEDGAQVPESGTESKPENGGEVTGDGSVVEDGEDSTETEIPEVPENGSQQPDNGAVELPEEGTEQPDNGAEQPDAGVSVPETPDAGNQPQEGESSQEQGGLTAEEQQQAADVQACLNALPQQAVSLDDVNLVVEATRAYLSLNDAQRETLHADSVRHLEALQQQAAVLNRSSNGVTIEGDFPWYIQFRVQEYTQGEQPALPQNAGADTVIAPYDMLLWDLMNQQEYHLSGQQVRITMPAPDMELFSQLVVLHYLEDGSVEYITPVNNGDGTISFLTTSFSPYNLAGSQVLVGNTNWLYTPSVIGGTSSSSGSTQSSSQSSASSNKGSSSGNQTQTLTGTVSTGSQNTSQVNQVAATNDPQNPLLYAGMGAAALIILAGAAVGVKKSAARRRQTDETKE